MGWSCFLPGDKFLPSSLSSDNEIAMSTMQSLVWWVFNMQIWNHWSSPTSSSWFKSSGMELYMAEISYFVKPTLGPRKKFQQSNRAEEVIITRLRIGHTKANKSHFLSRGPPTACHYCGQTLTIDHILLECAVLQECHDEYYTADSLSDVTTLRRLPLVGHRIGHEISR